MSFNKRLFVVIRLTFDLSTHGGLKVAFSTLQQMHLQTYPDSSLALKTLKFLFGLLWLPLVHQLLFCTDGFHNHLSFYDQSFSTSGDRQDALVEYSC